MFKKLHKKFVLINMLTTSVILVAAFAAIFFIANLATNNRAIPKDMPDYGRTTHCVSDDAGPDTDIIVEEGESCPDGYTEDDLPGSEKEHRTEFQTYMQEKFKQERKEAMSVLLITLIVTGICVEAAVFIISNYLADYAIRPVRDAYSAQKEFVANASHEIKTPLAVISANLEAADIHGNQWIDNIAVKVDDLTSLNNQLLTLSRIDAHTLSVEKREIAIGAFVEDLTKPLEAQIDKKGAKLTLKKNDHEKVTVDTAALKQIVNILLDNAIKYCKKKIRVETTNKSIKVTNDGTTIDDEKIKHIFERFYQVDKTKNGVGLGLAIASRVAAENNWKLSAASDKNSTAFTLEF